MPSTVSAATSESSAGNATSDDDGPDGSIYVEDEDDLDEENVELLELAAFLSVNCTLEKLSSSTTNEASLETGSNVGTADGRKIVHGRDAALKKLEQKASLLSKAGRTNVKLGQVHMMRNGYETRSIVKIRVNLGVSVTYGILLRWKNGLVQYVILHKFPTKSFLDDDTIVVSPRYAPETVQNNSSRWMERVGCTPISSTKPSPAQMRFFYTDMSPNSRQDDINTSCTVVIQPRISQSGGNQDTEVTILHPPWYVSRPAKFEKPILTVTIHKATGLRKFGFQASMKPNSSIHSFVKTSLKKDSNKTGVVRMRGNPIWEDVDNNVSRLQMDPSADRFLKVEIFDSKPIKNVRLSKVFVPLALVESRNNNEKFQITIPCPMRGSPKGSYGSITLSLSLHDPRKEWLDCEMKARAKIFQTTPHTVQESCGEKPFLCGGVGAEDTSNCALVNETEDLLIDWFTNARNWWFC